MPVYSQTSVFIASNELAVSGFANQVELKAEADLNDVTTFASGGFRQRVVGLGSFMLNASGFQDYVGPSPGTVFSPQTLGTLDTFTVSVPGTAVADPAYFGTARETSGSDLGAVGDVNPFSIGWAGTSRLIRGQMLHPSASRTATGNGTTTTFTPPTATQALHAAFHVHSVTGTGTITFTVQTDDNSGMTSATTRLTSTAFAAVGGELKSATGALTGETHIRVVYTISGFTAVTFSVAAGVGTP
jgi:hypothetical protein